MKWEFAARAADSKGARDVVILEVAEVMVVSDEFVIASAPNERQVKAIVDGIEERLRALDARPLRREGEREGRWVLLDYVDFVVHVFHPQTRGFYQLETLWGDATRWEAPAAGE